MSREISNTDDVIDSREVIERIAELEGERDDWNEGDPESRSIGWQSWEVSNEDDASELEILKSLSDQAEPYASDWQHGETLVRKTYWVEYAQDLASDCDMVPRDLSWPLSCIDWEQAARELAHDYTQVDFDGVIYLVLAS